MSTGRAPAPRFGVVTGLGLEASVLRRSAPGSLMVRTGLGPRAAAAAAAELIKGGCQVLVSFGLAGGLAPHLRAGDPFVADSVVARDGAAIDTDPAWRSQLLAAADDRAATLHVGPLAGSERPVATVEGKLMLHQATHALATDMESHEVAVAAQRSGLPLIVLRVIADTADRPIPAPVLVALTPDGRVRPARLAGGIARAPWLLPPVLRLAGDGRRALRALDGAARLLGSALASPDDAVRRS